MSKQPDYNPHFSTSADNNKMPILEQLRTVLNDGNRVLEIASGTGQHALCFSADMPAIDWQPSDRDLQAFGLAETLAKQTRANLLELIVVDIAHWPPMAAKFDAVYSSNCLHIISSELVEPYISGAASCLRPGGSMLLYGPYKYGGNFTTPSNQDFDGFLRKTYPGGGIRDIEMVKELARANGLVFVSDTPMPANNQFMIWRKPA
jgi:cyclopropane fatty-acyl-phospholipid synthase-like methyltransferase